jgi:hypothetical protein
MTQVLRFVPTVELAGFWPRLGLKVAVAVAASWTIGFVIAQAPTAAPGMAASEGVDARGYKVLVPHALFTGPKGKTEDTTRHNQARQVLSGTTPLGPDNRNQFVAYYTLGLFPLMTQTTDEALKKLPDERQSFLRNDLEAGARQPEAHNLLLGLTLQAMTNIVRDNQFHPAVRYNAMMIISSLNDQEVVRVGGTPALPEPMARALDVILKEFTRPENPDSIKIAALLGLSRHLEWENEKSASSPAMPAASRKTIMDELRKVALEKDPPAGRTAEGHTWIRRRAIEALGFACLKKPDADVAELLDVLLKDETQPLPLRSTVAATMGRISYQPPAKVDPLATSKELGYLALVACDAELTRVAALKKGEEEHFLRMAGQYSGESGYGSGMMPPGGPRATGSADGGTGPRMMPGTAGYTTTATPRYSPSGLNDGGYGGSGFDPALEDPKAYRFDYVRRRIRQQLYSVQLGLTGGEDHVPPKASGAQRPPLPPPGGAATPSGAAAAAASGTAGGTTSGMPAPASPKGGMFYVAGAQKQQVDDVYAGVRKLAEDVEKAIDLAQLEKDLRRDMKKLETTIGRRLAAATTTSSTASADDLPGASASPAAKPAGGKATAPGAKTPAAPGPARPPAPAPGTRGAPSAPPRAGATWKPAGAPFPVMASPARR